MKGLYVLEMHNGPILSPLATEDRTTALSVRHCPLLTMQLSEKPRMPTFYMDT